MSERELTFAIGDIHGRLDLLKRLFDEISQLSGGRPYSIVFIGDYIDRGPDTAGVIAAVRSLQAKDPAHVHCLMGNHEQMLLMAVEDPATSAFWQEYGGRHTLTSFGVRDPENLPADVVEWIRGLPTFWEDELRYFVHAGVHPDWPLSRQIDRDRLWIREPFLSRRHDFGKHVVHGHTPVRMKPGRRPKPQEFRNRTNIDTGAVFGGALTAAMFDSGRAHPMGFMQVLQNGEAFFSVSRLDQPLGLRVEPWQGEGEIARRIAASIVVLALAGGSLAYATRTGAFNGAGEPAVRLTSTVIEGAAAGDPTRPFAEAASGSSQASDADQERTLALADGALREQEPPPPAEIVPAPIPLHAGKDDAVAALPELGLSPVVNEPPPEQPSSVAQASESERTTVPPPSSLDRLPEEATASLGTPASRDREVNGEREFDVALAEPAPATPGGSSARDAEPQPALSAPALTPEEVSRVFSDLSDQTPVVATLTGLEPPPSQNAPAEGLSDGEVTRILTALADQTPEVEGLAGLEPPLPEDSSSTASLTDGEITRILTALADQTPEVEGLAGLEPTPRGALTAISGLPDAEAAQEPATLAGQTPPASAMAQLDRAAQEEPSGPARLSERDVEQILSNLLQQTPEPGELAGLPSPSLGSREIQTAESDTPSAIDSPSAAKANTSAAPATIAEAPSIAEPTPEEVAGPAESSEDVGLATGSPVRREITPTPRRRVFVASLPAAEPAPKLRQADAPARRTDRRPARSEPLAMPARKLASSSVAADCRAAGSRRDGRWRSRCDPATTGSVVARFMSGSLLRLFERNRGASDRVGSGRDRFAELPQSSGGVAGSSSVGSGAASGGSSSGRGSGVGAGSGGVGSGGATGGGGAAGGGNAGGGGNGGGNGNGNGGGNGGGNGNGKGGKD